jgi:pimeloyl-ACP methyl ester carboxylesterase
MPQAFLVYRSPSDFPRQGAEDADVAIRYVYLQIDASTGQSGVRVQVVRPPVALVHGLWDDWRTWNTFDPLVTGPETVDSRFSVLRVSYDHRVGSLIQSSTPSYSGVRSARANSLGFDYNARGVLRQITKWRDDFKSGRNPAYMPVAAVQADVVAHSMGGDIARTLGLPRFNDTNTFGKGVVHKLITIDTPHLGSAVATKLSHQANSCLRNLLTWAGKFSFQSVVFRNGQTTPGAIGDLRDDFSNQGLQDIASQSVRPVRAAMIAGIYTDLGSLDASSAPDFFRHQWFGCPNDPLAQALTSQAWPSVFGGNDNDAIVSVNSQLNGGSGLQRSGFVHSSGTTSLGFAPPSILDAAASTAEDVIQLLNTPVSDSSQFRTIP